MADHKPDDYMRVFAKLLEHRQATLAEIDKSIDSIVARLVGCVNMTADQEVDAYLALRNAKENTNGYQTKRDETLKKSIETTGNRLLKRLNTQGVKSMRATSGTFYKEEVHRPSCADWPTFYKWIAENDAFEMLEKRVTKKVVIDYLEREEKLPPGINLNSSFEARVRKGSEA